MRNLTRFTAALSLGFVAACASAPGGGSAPAPAGTPSGTGNAPAPQAAVTWPVRTREHVDLWLHSYALLTNDTTLVPYFQRGYRTRMTEVRRQRGATSLLDTNRDRLLARIAVNPSLATNGQFLPLYFASYEQMRQVIDAFLRDNGTLRVNDPALQAYYAILGGSFQTAADREWLRTFNDAVDDESRKFYHAWWTTDQQGKGAVVARVDSLWQRQWRPALQRFLNNSQQQNGELYLSLPLGGEGRTVHFGKSDNAVAGPMPASLAESEIVLYVMAHEITGAVASAAITDNTSPADLRNGVTSRYEQSAAVRAGAMLLEKTLPAAVPGYMRYYLGTAGRTAPSDPRALFASTFALPDAIRDALARQFDVILGGI